MYEVVLDVLKAKNDQNQPHLQTSSVSNGINTVKGLIPLAQNQIRSNIEGYHIRLYNLVIGWHAFECNIWFLVRPY